MFYKRPIYHPARAKLVAYLAERCGVTVEHFLDIVKKRKEYRRARMYWKRARQRRKAYVSKSGVRRKEKMGAFEKKRDVRYAGEGDLDVLLRVVGLNGTQFARIADFPHAQFKAWHGHCMYGWPVEFLRYYGWAQNMSEKLKSMGIDPDEFKPQIPDRMAGGGRYPRKKDAIKIEAEPEYTPWK